MHFKYDINYHHVTFPDSTQMADHPLPCNNIIAQFITFLKQLLCAQPTDDFYVSGHTIVRTML